MTHLDEDYYNWLVSQIHVPNGKTYQDIYRRMYDLEFVPFVPNDDNRTQDGKDLRIEFLNGHYREGSLNHRLISVLEVLVALSRRVAFTAGGDSTRWAWKLVKNLGLNQMSDPLADAQLAKVDEILDNLVWRTYAQDGRGGFFPLTDAIEDQTKVELWYQMNAYVNEMPL